MARLLHQRAGDRHALLLPARQRIGAVHREFGDAEAIQRADRQRPFLRGEQLQQRAPGGERRLQPPAQHVGQHVEPRHEIELLEDHRGTGAPGMQRAAAKLGDVTALEQQASFARIDQPD